MLMIETAKVSPMKKMLTMHAFLDEVTSIILPIKMPEIAWPIPKNMKANKQYSSTVLSARSGFLSF